MKIVILLYFLFNFIMTSKNKSFERSCNSIRYRNGILYANCRRRNGSWASSSILLSRCRNKQIHYLNGILVC